jgi:hypothetical protein
MVAIHLRASIVFSFALTLAFLWSAQVSAQSHLRIENVETKLVGGPDGAGFVTFTVRAWARNVSRYGEWFFVAVKAMDNTGSSLCTVDLRGRIGGREVGFLDGIGTLTLDEYTSIARWIQIPR